MEQIDSDMYFYLDSSKSKEYYPTNSSASFTNVLPNELSFEDGKWEAGVVWIQFFDKYEEAVNPASKEKNFFGHDEGHNILKIREGASITLQMTKTDVGMDKFITLINRQLQRLTQADVLRTRNEGSEQYVHIQCPNELKGRLMLLPELRHVLGFPEASIVSSAYGTFPVDEDYYRGLEDGTLFSITFSVDTVKEIEIPEPREYNFESLVESYSAHFYTQFPNTS
jgi:hypothetical protein